MTEDTKAIEYTTYFFAFRFNVAGLVDSDLDVEELRTRLAADLAAIYGDEGFEILEVRKAEADEIEGISAVLNENKTLN